MDITSSQSIMLVTHNGAFHADEVFAIAVLKMIYGERLHVVRTRDEDVVAQADMVVDVGMVYDYDTYRFDHHQQDGAGVRSTNGIPYSSFGLIWKHFGNTLVSSSIVREMLDAKLVSAVDAIDNGIELVTRMQDVYPSEYGISHIIKLFRPTWKSASPETFDAGFMDAVVCAQTILTKEIRALTDMVDADSYVRTAYDRADDKRIIELDRYAPWEHVLKEYPEPLCVIYPSTSGTDWCAEVVRTDPRIFASNRIAFPVSWAGKRDEELERVTGVAGSVFVHNARFIAVARSKEAIHALVQYALEAAGMR